MAGRDTRNLLNGIVAEIIKVGLWIEGYQYEDFYQDEKVYASVLGCMRAISEMEQAVPTMVRVKYALVPWKELAALDAAITNADPVNRPRLLWKISTETLPQIRPMIQNLIEEMEK